MKTKLLLCASILLAPLSPSAQTFDFWDGEWNAHINTPGSSGNIVGENKIERILDGRALLETWSDVRGFDGTSLTMFDSIQQCWRQTWMDNTGGIAQLTGHLRGDTMIFVSGPVLNKAGQTEMTRMYIIRRNKDELHQFGEISFDSSATWAPTFNLIYKRKTTGLTKKLLQPLRLAGVKIRVPDLPTARRFYSETLGFAVDGRFSDDRKVVLYSKSIRLFLEEDKSVTVRPLALGPVSLALQVNDLDSTLARLTLAGVHFLSREKRKEGVGFSMKIADPFGNVLSLLQQTIVPTPAFVEPKIYNCGLYVPDMAQARRFYAEQLGLIERSQKYLPDDMPLGYSDNQFAFMLHLRRNDFPFSGKTAMLLLFETPNVEKIFLELSQLGISATWEKGALEVVDKSGAVFEIFEGK